MKNREVIARDYMELVKLSQKEGISFNPSLKISPDKKPFWKRVLETLKFW